MCYHDKNIKQMELLQKLSLLKSLPLMKKVEIL